MSISIYNKKNKELDALKADSDSELIDMHIKTWKPTLYIFTGRC